MLAQCIQGTGFVKVMLVHVMRCPNNSLGESPDNPYVGRFEQLIPGLQ